MRRVWWVSLVLATVAACGSSTSGPTLTGVGATVSDWNQHHGSAYTSVVTDSAGRVEAYTVTMAAVPLSQAEALIRRDLPTDATGGPVRVGHGVEGSVCQFVQFTSPTLGRLMGAGGDRVTAAFSAANATVMDTAHIARAVVVSGEESTSTEC